MSEKEKEKVKAAIRKAILKSGKTAAQLVEEDEEERRIMISAIEMLEKPAAQRWRRQKTECSE